MEMRLGDHLDFSSGSGSRVHDAEGPVPVYGANGMIGYAAEPNERGPLIVLGRVGTYCGTVRYCDFDVWVTENALVCRAKHAEETRFWYYALQTCRLNGQRTGSGQPLLNQRILRDISLRAVAANDRRRIVALLGALDDKIASNERVIEVAEALMLATAESVSEYVSLSNLASRSAHFLNPADFDEKVAHFSLPAFDEGAKPQFVHAKAIRSGKFLLSQPCVLVAKLNPRIPRMWNVVTLPSEMAVASTEFVVLHPIDLDTSELWSAVRQPEVSNALRQRVAGTSGSHQRIRPHDLLQVRVRDVRRLSSAASRAIISLGALCHARRVECVRLSAFRETLLPLLIAGKVRIEPPDRAQGS